MIEFKGEAIGARGPRRGAGSACLRARGTAGPCRRPDMSLTENAVLTGRDARGLDRGTGFVGWAKARAFAEEIIERFDVRTPGPGVAARALSGGNLQKYVIGREILQRPSAGRQPAHLGRGRQCRRRAIRQALLDLAQNGAAVVVISQDLDELLEVSDRFCALNEGRLSRRARRAA
jgi:ABC-type uncharacterized transport system ATPase subunit